MCVVGGGGGVVKYKFSYLCFRSSQSVTILGKISVDRDNPQQNQLGRHPLTLAFTAAGIHFERIHGGESRDSLHLYSDIISLILNTFSYGKAQIPHHFFVANFL